MNAGNQGRRIGAPSHQPEPDPIFVSSACGDWICKLLILNV